MRDGGCELVRMVRALHPSWSCRRLRCDRESDRGDRAWRQERPAHGVRIHTVETLRCARRLRPHNA